MNTDILWQALRYLMIVGGSFLVAKGYLTAEQVTTVANEVVTIVGGIATVAPIAWGLWVRWHTRAVPAATAARSDVPTVSAATGAVTPATTPPPKSSTREK